MVLKEFQVRSRTFFGKIHNFTDNIWLFLILLLVKPLKAKENFIDYHGHKILRLNDILPNFSFAKSKTEHGNQ